MRIPEAIFIGLNSESIFFFLKNLFHLKKTEFTLETLTHARICKVLACVALKHSGLYFPFAVLDLGFPSVGGGWTLRNLALRSICTIFICSPSPVPRAERALVWRQFGLWGWKKDSEGTKAELVCKREVPESQLPDYPIALQTTDSTHRCLSTPFLGCKCCVLWTGERRVSSQA